MKKIIKFIIFIFLITSEFTFAEKIILKNGREIQGKIVEKTNEYIKILVRGIPITYYLDEIERIKDLSSDISLKELVIYRNEEWGFLIKYPKAWSIFEDKETKGIFQLFLTPVYLPKGLNLRKIRENSYLAEKLLQEPSLTLAVFREYRATVEGYADMKLVSCRSILFSFRIKEKPHFIYLNGRKWLKYTYEYKSHHGSILTTEYAYKDRKGKFFVFVVERSLYRPEKYHSEFERIVRSINWLRERTRLFP